ncbi:MAG: hypothetical protein OXH20_00025 [bacterium]|nr:hypothetical protein [bacterium]
MGEPTVRDRFRGCLLGLAPVPMYFAADADGLRDQASSGGTAA